MNLFHNNGPDSTVSEKSAGPSFDDGFRVVMTESGRELVVEGLPKSLANELRESINQAQRTAQKWGRHVARLDALILDLRHAEGLLPRLPDVFSGSHDADLITRSKLLSALHHQAADALEKMVSELQRERAELVAPVSVEGAQ